MENKDLPMSAPVATPTPDNKKILIIALVIIALILLCVGGIVALLIINNSNKPQIAIDPIVKSCEYNGKTYEDGERFEALDGCNTCLCNNGAAACTEMACINDDEMPSSDDGAAGGIEETLIGKLLVTSEDKFYAELPYPDTILNLKASDLQTLTCYDVYAAYGTVKQGQVSDPIINAFIDSLKSQDVSVISMNWCKTEGGEYIVEYEHCSSSCGGGGGTIAYFGILKNNSLTKETQIPNQLGAYFSCNKTIALSKANELYVRCGAGDGPSSAAAIFKVNLNSATFETILKESRTGDY